MEQELISKSVAIIGGGPAGCACAYFLGKNGIKNVAVFEKGDVLHTILPTGGGKCNLANAIYDYKELASNYPRGEKFLYSVFSKFATSDTLEFFNEMGIKTYTRQDGHIFPESNSSKDVRQKFLKALECKFITQEIQDIKPLLNKYDAVVVSIGGHAGLEIIKNLYINTVEQTPSLVGYTTKEDFSSLAGVSINNILFTHKGVSGPYIHTISSINARKKLPYNIVLKLAQINDLQELLNANPHKEIKNLLGQFIPKSLAVFILNKLDINEDTACHQINGKTRDKIKNTIENFEITVTGKVLDGEIVSCGGVDLKEIDSKTMASKKYPNLYFCGEILDIDGFCGGFNLQNCWSTAFVAAEAIKKHLC